MQVEFGNAFAQAMCWILRQLPSFLGAGFRRLLNLLRVAQRIPEYLSMMIEGPSESTKYNIYSHQSGHAGAFTSFPLNPIRIWQTHPAP